MSQQREVRWIYVTGYGRSGSTVIGRLIGESTGATVLGEVSSAAWLLDTEKCNHECTCGHLLPDCEVWGSLVGPEWSSPRNGWMRLLGIRRPQGAPLDLAIAETVHRNCGLVIDISKTDRANAARPLALASQGFDVRCVHVFRDWKGVLGSELAKRERRSLRDGKWPRVIASARAGFGWSMANLAAMGNARRLPPNHSMSLSYEDLFFGDIELADVLRAVEVPLDTDRIGRQSTLATTEHLIAGNRMRKGTRTSSEVTATPEPSNMESVGFLLFGWIGMAVTATLRRKPDPSGSEDRREAPKSQHS